MQPDTARFWILETRYRQTPDRQIPDSGYRQILETRNRQKPDTARFWKPETARNQIPPDRQKSVNKPFKHTQKS